MSALSLYQLVGVFLLSIGFFGLVWRRTLVGMVISILLWLPFSILFGAMEVMVPLMLTGMLSGMVVSMYLAMESLGAWTCLHIGAASGFVSIVLIWIFNNAVSGTQPAPWR